MVLKLYDSGLVMLKENFLWMLYIAWMKHIYHVSEAGSSWLCLQVEVKDVYAMGPIR
jgi:hypothetical protein